MSKLSFLGAGNMASAIIKALLTKGQINPNDITATHYRQDKLEDLITKFPLITTIDSNIEAIKSGDIVFLCVRPQQIKALSEEVQSHCTPDKIIVSIAAGIRLHTLRRLLPYASKIFHLHPSSLIFQSDKKHCVSFLTSVPKYQREMQLIVDLFSPISEVLIVDESEINKFIVMVGCVPGYLALIWKYLFEISGELGIENEMAFEIENRIIAGTQRTMLEDGYRPRQLIDLIATSGGVTRAGIKALEENGLKQVLRSAVIASLQKLKELSENAM